jgi:hypothetical protein
MLTVVTWLWGTKYPPEYVYRLRAGVKRHLKTPHRFVCVTNRKVDCETIPLEDPQLLPVRDGCYVRLRMFDPEWQERHGIERIVCLDLDLICVGTLDPLFDGPEPFLILHGGHFNPCPFNGSVQMITRGACPEIWSRFNVEEAEKAAVIEGKWRGSDQTWIAHVAPDAPGWTYEDGIYGFRKPGWPRSNELPKNARIVAFPGGKDPSKFTGYRWLRENWQA